MKKMNVIPLIMSVFLLFSCTEQEQIISESIAKKSIAKENQEKENEYLLAQQVFYAATLEKIDQLENQLAELIGNKESGNKGAINEIEKTQKQIEKYKKASDYFYSMRPPKLPRPLPRPRPCMSENSSCNPKILNIQQIIIGDDNDLVINNLKVVSKKGNIVGKGEMGEGKYGITVNMEVEKFKGQATMYVELSISNKTKLSLDIPVRGN